MTGDAFAQDWPGARGPKRSEGALRTAKLVLRGAGRSVVVRRLRTMDDLIALGRMWKGGPFGGSGWGPHRRGRGRARRGDVRLALLRLLAEQPATYQLMQAIEERSEGLWRPQPGSVYPPRSRNWRMRDSSIRSDT